MAAIEYQPPKKIIVHELYKYGTINDLIRTRLAPDGIRPLFWCDGIIFSAYSMDGDEAKKEYISGMKHIQILDYAEMKEYKSVLEFEDELVRGAKIRVFDFGKYQQWKEVVKWLKSQK